MKIDDVYSFNGGIDFFYKNKRKEILEINEAIRSLSAIKCLVKESKERNKSLLLSPKEMNKNLKDYFMNSGWTHKSPNTKKGFIEPKIHLGDNSFIEMDGVKNRVGLEIQFGKYSFVSYDICSKMVIFNKRDVIDCGVEIVVMNSVLPYMSTGVGSFSNIKSLLDARGAADNDIPVVVIGINLNEEERFLIDEKRNEYDNFNTSRLLYCSQDDCTTGTN